MNIVLILLFRNDQIASCRGVTAAIRHARANGLYARLAELGALTEAERAVCPALAR